MSPLAQGSNAGQHSGRSSFFGLIYEDLIPQDHKRIVRLLQAGCGPPRPGLRPAED